MQHGPFPIDIQQLESWYAYTYIQTSMDSSWDPYPHVQEPFDTYVYISFPFHFVLLLHSFFLLCLWLLRIFSPLTFLNPLLLVTYSWYFLVYVGISCTLSVPEKFDKKRTDEYHIATRIYRIHNSITHTSLDHHNKSCSFTTC